LTKKWQKDFNMHVHSNEGDVIKMHQHLVTIVLMSYTLSKLYVDIKFDMLNMKFKNHLFYLPLAIGQVDNLASPPLAVNPTTIRSLLSTICLAEKYKDKLYNVCCDPTRNRTHEYISRNLIDNSFEFNWKKKQWYDITICTDHYQSIQLASW
jgi:hypothetical protein